MRRPASGESIRTTAVSGTRMMDGDRNDRHHARQRARLRGERRADARPAVAVAQPPDLELGDRLQVVELVPSIWSRSGESVTVRCPNGSSISPLPSSASVPSCVRRKAERQRAVVEVRGDALARIERGRAARPFSGKSSA